jgi:hypothetical protein
MRSRIFLLLGVLAPSVSLAEPATTGTTVPVLGKYTAPESDKDNKPRGISGMGCLGRPGDASRECLVINDEETSGEVAVLTKGGLTPTGKLVLFTSKKGPATDVRGTEQPAACGDTGKFGELDGEGVAVTKDYAYVIGSHSCTGGGKYKASSYLLVRFKPASANTFVGTTPPVVERTWRGADMLLLSDDVGSAYGKPKGLGTNIEGLAVIGDTLYAGLRAPVTDGTAYIVSARVDDLFAPGHERLKSVAQKPIKLSLGANIGIRDLAALDNGGLLILSGPAGSNRGEYKIWHLPAPLNSSQPALLTGVTTTAEPKDPAEEPKAESITVIDQAADKVTVVVNYDNIGEGAPATYEIQLSR